MNKIDETIGARMEELREKNNLKLVEVGRKIGVDYRTIRKFEEDKQKPNSDIIERYCKCFKVSPDYLFYGEEISNLELEKALNKLSPKQRRAVMTIIDSYH